MKNYFVAIFFPLLLAVSAEAQKIPAMGIEQIFRYTASKDTTYIINFWATWCAPCVEELPVFNALKRRYEGTAVKVLLVSLDFRETYPKLPLFLQRKQVEPEVVWLSDTNPNEYVPRIDNNWEGSIPATMIVRPGMQKSKFIEGQVTERQVSGIVNKMMKN